jgi:hypothetical protein
VRLATSCEKLLSAVAFGVSALPNQMAFSVACRLAPVGAKLSRVGVFRVNRIALRCHARQLVRRRPIVSRRPDRCGCEQDLGGWKFENQPFPSRQLILATAIFVFITGAGLAALYW